MANDRFLKNQMRDTTPQSLKGLNDNFDYLYTHLNEALDSQNVGTINFTSPDIFDVVYEDGKTENYCVSRNADGFIDKLSDGTIEISILR
ncbi:MAG TPA: hypothetical protein VIK72_19175 [Clostridiaceae bacterium]